MGRYSAPLFCHVTFIYDTFCNTCFIIEYHVLHSLCITPKIIYFLIVLSVISKYKNMAPIETGVVTLQLLPCYLKCAFDFLLFLFAFTIVSNMLFFYH